MAKEKSILYFMGTWAVGGVERVTAELANEWIRRGWRVSVFAFTMENDLLRKDLSDKVTFVVPNAGVMTDASAAALRRVIVEQKVAYVVNDWCLPFKTTRFLRRVCKGLDVRQIACLHNVPNHNARIAGARNPLVRALYRVASQANMFLAYLFCDRYVVLSESFKPIFRRFACVPFARRLDAIGNPLTIHCDAAPQEEKENVLLYVGRLEEKQKKFSRVAAMWKNELADALPDWRLEVVGDGPDRAAYEASLAGVPRVVFHGFQNPAPFYAKAKILVMTSDFEGFPLVLVEAMSAGCVPVVLDSFAAVHDIIDGANGVLVPAPFDESRFAASVDALMRAAPRLASLSAAARATSRNFSVASIVDKWETLLAGL